MLTKAFYIHVCVCTLQLWPVDFGDVGLMDGFFRWLATAYDLPQREAIVVSMHRAVYDERLPLKTSWLYICSDLPQHWLCCACESVCVRACSVVLCLHCKSQ